MPTLIHGTTRQRAESIIRNGPDPSYLEPGGVPSNDGFSMYLDGGPYIYKAPEEYARGKDLQCPNEGGPVLLVVEDVPEVVLDAVNRDGTCPMWAGVFQFNIGDGLEELMLHWPLLTKTIRAI
jgi:hypothetical protein